MDWDSLYSFKKKFLIDFTQIMLCWTWSHRRGIWRFLSLFSIRHTEFILRYGYPNPYFGLKWLSNYFHCHYLLFSGANVSTISYIQSKSRQARWKWTNNGYFYISILRFSWISANSSILQNMELICSLVKRSVRVRAGIRRN